MSAYVQRCQGENGGIDGARQDPPRRPRALQQLPSPFPPTATRPPRRKLRPRRTTRARSNPRALPSRGPSPVSKQPRPRPIDGARPQSRTVAIESAPDCRRRVLPSALSRLARKGGERARECFVPPSLSLRPAPLLKSPLRFPDRPSHNQSATHATTRVRAHAASPPPNARPRSQTAIARFERDTLSPPSPPSPPPNSSRLPRPPPPAPCRDPPPRIRARRT